MGHHVHWLCIGGMSASIGNVNHPFCFSFVYRIRIDIQPRDGQCTVRRVGGTGGTASRQQHHRRRFFTPSLEPSLMSI